MDGHAGPANTEGELVAALTRAGGGAVVAVDGRSGSGKTALAARLAATIPDVRVLHLDDVYRGWWGLQRGLDHMAALALAPLARGEAGRYRPWDWETGRPGDWVDVAPLRAGELLLLEGCGSLAAPCDTHVTLGVWCRAPEEIRRRRALERDDWHWAEHWDHWARQEGALTYRRVPDLRWEAPTG